MAEPDLIDLLGAMAEYFDARNSEATARQKHEDDGEYSWDYYGSDYIDRVDSCYTAVQREWVKVFPGESLLAGSYHPDPEIDAEIVQAALEAEIADLAAGYAPRFWRCPCGAGHSRGHFQAVGVHRCLRCGYVGAGGTMHTHDAEGRLVA